MNFTSVDHAKLYLADLEVMQKKSKSMGDMLYSRPIMKPIEDQDEDYNGALRGLAELEYYLIVMKLKVEHWIEINSQ